MLPYGVSSEGLGMQTLVITGAELAALVTSAKLRTIFGGKYFMYFAIIFNLLFNVLIYIAVDDPAVFRG